MDAIHEVQRDIGGSAVEHSLVNPAHGAGQKLSCCSHIGPVIDLAGVGRAVQ